MNASKLLKEIVPPAFDFKTVDGATAYRFRVVVDGMATNFFTAANALAQLSNMKRQ